MNPLIEKMLGNASRLTRSGKLLDATAAIQRALGGTLPPALARGAPSASGHAGVVLEGLVRERPEPGTPAAPSARRDPAGSFHEASFSGSSGTRAYRLFVPAGHGEAPLPLVVMLHGCTQTPEDFAAGTRMNEVAQERGFLVLYPAQAPRSNASKCWNWFVPGDQRRGAGEPELIAGMTRHVIATQRVDPARVYVAGLSAGGSMADILGREYPDLFAAVGVHSGLAQGAAHDVASAFAAMSQGALRRAPPSGVLAAPAIVFHGDRDSTVNPSNGEHVVGATLAASGTPHAGIAATTSRSTIGGLDVSRTVHRREGAGAGEANLAEHWVVHGAGHAWAGGNAAGSYVEPRGPDASREMIRFFEQHARRRA